MVTSHFNRKIKILGGDPRRETLTSIPIVDGNSYLHAEEGNYWRGYHFIGNASTFEVAENLDQVYNAAKAFGKFQNLLSDYPSEQLIETIPDFHNTRVRFDTFIEAVESDDLNRASLSKPEIAFVMKRVKDTSVLIDKRERGELPERITHNDTNFNKVMIENETDSVDATVVDATLRLR